METKQVKNSSGGCTRPLHCNGDDTDNDTGEKEGSSPVVSSTTTTTTALFFREQGDMVSEILSFLDLRSLLTMCSTHKKAVSCLRYEHVVSSTFNKRTSESGNRRTRTMDRNAIIILNKLVNVYGLEGDSTTTTTSRNTNNTKNNSTNNNNTSITATEIANRWRKSTTPSTMRLLRLVNGRKCERCYRDLVSPCVWATGSSGFVLGCGGSSSDSDTSSDSDSSSDIDSSTAIVLPSLSFGKFCCTQCIFDTTRFLSPLPLASKQNRNSTRSTS